MSARTVGLALLVGGLAACGPAGEPVELIPPTDQVIAVNDEVVVTLAARNVDDDALDYGFDAEPEDIQRRARIDALPSGAAEFRWTPLAADVGVWPFEFSVSDGNYSDRVTIMIDVRPAVGDGSEPRFIHPAGGGTTFDLATASCIQLDVEVFDADTTDVTLALGEPMVEGTELTQVSGMLGEFRWCPTPAQVDADDRYSVSFTADDHDNPIAQHPYLMVLRRPGSPDCPGDPPVIAHAPVNVTSVVGLTIEAEVSDDLGLKREPLLYWSDVAPGVVPDLGAMNQVAMQRIGGDMKSGTWAADVPNPVAGLAVGQTRALHYVIVAVDDDDPTGACDNVGQAPATAAYAIDVTRPAGEGGAAACSRCSHDVQCGDTADLCVEQGVAPIGFCLEACDAGSCPTGYQCSAAALTSVGGVSARQCLPVAGECSPIVCHDDDREDNDTRLQADVRPRLLIGDHELISCPAASGSGDDEDWFEFGVTQDTTLTFELVGGDDTDLDLALYDVDGNLLASSVSFTSTEDVVRCVAGGTYYVRVYAFGTGTGPNPYQLSYSRSAGACP